MNTQWLKRYVPRSLYGRAALILLVPVVTLQLVVSVVFIQRHFEDVTRQMTEIFSIDLAFILSEIAAAESSDDAQARVGDLALALLVKATLPADDPPAQILQRRFYDLSGRIVILTLAERLPDLKAIDLKSDGRQLQMWFGTAHGDLLVKVHRNRVSASNPHQFLVLTIFVAIVMTLVAFIYLRNQLRPIRKLAQAAEAFGKGRIEPYRPTGATEVRSAGHAFLDMRSRIERQIEQRTMMLSGVSHDLRTPLTRLKLGLAMLDADEAAGLSRDVEEMERLLNEFLAFARGDAMDEQMETDPADLVRDLVARMTRGGAAVELGTIEGGGALMMRPTAISRALDNLIANGLRHGSRVRISVRQGPRRVSFIVEDDGPGIPEDQREQAVKAFARLDEARNQDKGGGVGLGLAIARDIARRHGGALVLGSSKELGGLRAEINLPR